MALDHSVEFGPKLQHGCACKICSHGTIIDCVKQSCVCCDL